MRPLADRLVAYLATLPTETTIDHAYGRVLAILAEERRLIAEAILAPRTVPPETFVRLKAELARVDDDIVIVEALRGRVRGDPPPKPLAPPTRSATTDSGYGEP